MSGPDNSPMAEVGDTDTIAWREVLPVTIARMDEAGLSTAEARWIVEEAGGIDLDEPVTRRCMARHDDLLRRRLAGEPLQYVLGHWSFRALDLMVDPRVLIPRPETEAVVGHALDEFDRGARGRSGGGRGAGPGAGPRAPGPSVGAPPGPPPRPGSPRSPPPPPPAPAHPPRPRGPP